MNLGLKFILFALAFFIEVEVDAHEVSWPKNCSFETSGCTLMNQEDVHWHVVKEDGIGLYLSPMGALTRRSENTLHLLEGKAFVRNSSGADLVVSFPSAHIVLPQAAEALIEVTSAIARVQTTHQDVDVWGGEGLFRLEPGFMIYRDLTHFPAAWSVPRAYDLTEMLQMRAAAGLGSPEDSAALARSWARATLRASRLSEDLVTRSLASERDLLERKRQVKSRDEQEAQRIRALFRQKNHLDL